MRALCREDAGPARALVSGELGGTRSEARVLEVLERACSGSDEENRGIVAIGEEAPPRGLALYGQIAGTRGAARVQALIGSEPAVLRALAGETVRVLLESETRLVVCELPEEPLFDAVHDALGAAGFVEEGRVPDLVRHGVTLRVLVRRADVRPA
jgi:hypothetical protein